MSHDQSSRWVLETPDGIRWLSLYEYTQEEINHKIANVYVEHNSFLIGREGHASYHVVGGSKVDERRKANAAKPALRRNLKLLLIATTMLAGCDFHVLPPEDIYKKEIDVATERCETNGGIKYIQKNGYRFWFVCNNEMKGVVIVK